jgi:hypothetical protein
VVDTISLFEQMIEVDFAPFPVFDRRQGGKIALDDLTSFYFPFWLRLCASPRRAE